MESWGQSEQKISVKRPEKAAYTKIFMFLSFENSSSERLAMAYFLKKSWNPNTYFASCDLLCKLPITLDYDSEHTM